MNLSVAPKKEQFELGDRVRVTAVAKRHRFYEKHLGRMRPFRSWEASGGEGFPKEGVYIGRRTLKTGYLGTDGDGYINRFVETSHFTVGLVVFSLSRNPEYVFFEDMERVTDEP